MQDNPDSIEPLPFVPVPSTSTRHDGWSEERQRAFIALLAEHGGVAAAARALGMTPQSARRLRTRAGGEDFARVWDLAQQIGRDRSYDRAVERGRDGYFVPVMRRGKVVGRRHRVDNRLLFAACYGQPMIRRDPDE